MAATKKKRLAAVPEDEPESIIEDDYQRSHPSDPSPSGLLAYVEDLLTRHERFDTPQARVAMVVARRLDFPALETGAGIVSLSKELDRLLGVALAGVNIESDELDELEKRRRAKAAQA